MNAIRRPLGRAWQARMGEWAGRCVNGPAMLLALRELRGTAAAPRGWAALAAAAVMVGLIGPFGTYDLLALPDRLAYWTANVITTFFAAVFTITFAEAWLAHRIGSRPLVLVLSAMVAALPVATIVVGIGSAVSVQGDGADLATLYAYCAVIILGIAVLLDLADHTTRTVPPRNAPPAILARLPLAKRGRLIRLTAQDHYTEVVTTEGSELILMRLSDAIGEAAPTDGLRTHRSHWVAKAAVKDSQRKSGRLFLTLEDGAETPVSRSQTKAARAAGLV